MADGEDFCAEGPAPRRDEREMSPEELRGDLSKKFPIFGRPAIMAST